MCLFLGLSAATASAADGNQLLDACQQAVKYFDGDKSDVDSFKALYCLGLVEGTRNTMVLLDQQDPAACVPASVANTQAVRIVVKYLRANPERLHLDASASILLSLMAAYPCPPRNAVK
ncbi:Rap1a/Tai family immunity protein [Acidovorax sp. HMWF018]|uniref:Rap1a/Tai family immunity protein n=1 Tax=Acidovorax sp. HMWF018 TaxID=2056855 RepID=UPI00351856E2